MSKSILEGMSTMVSRWIPVSVDKLSWIKRYKYPAFQVLLGPCDIPSCYLVGTTKRFDIMNGSILKDSECYGKIFSTNHLAIFTLRHYLESENGNLIRLNDNDIYRVALKEEVDWENVSLL